MSNSRAKKAAAATAALAAEGTIVWVSGKVGGDVLSATFGAVDVIALKALSRRSWYNQYPTPMERLNAATAAKRRIDAEQQADKITLLSPVRAYIASSRYREAQEEVSRELALQAQKEKADLEIAAAESRIPLIREELKNQINDLVPNLLKMNQALGIYADHDNIRKEARFADVIRNKPGFISVEELEMRSKHLVAQLVRMLRTDDKDISSVVSAAMGVLEEIRREFHDCKNYSYASYSAANDSMLRNLENKSWTAARDKTTFAIQKLKDAVQILDSEL